MASVEQDAPSANESKRVRVEAARKVIGKPSELFDVAEGRLVAMRALAFGEHTFDEDDGAVPIAEVLVIDLSAPEPRPLAHLEISWKRVIRQLRVAGPDAWQVGTLIEEPEYHAKELEPPGEDVDLDAIADKIGGLVTSLGQPKQLELGTEDVKAADDEDDIPF